MEKVLLLILTVGFVNGSLHKLGHILKKRRSDPDMIDFTPEVWFSSVLILLVNFLVSIVLVNNQVCVHFFVKLS